MAKNFEKLTGQPTAWCNEVTSYELTREGLLRMAMAAVREKRAPTHPPGPFSGWRESLFLVRVEPADLGLANSDCCTCKWPQ